ncbi:MAG: GtrA family protein [Syntrophomonadaceae bacterium]
MKYIKGNLREYATFIASGAINSALTYVLYILLLTLVSYKVSYSIAYVSGIFVSYYLNSRWVFKEPMSLMKFLQYPVVYIVQYLLGIATLYVCVDKLGLSQWLAPLVVIAVTVPVTFFLSRYIIKRPSRDVVKGEGNAD